MLPYTLSNPIHILLISLVHLLKWVINSLQLIFKFWIYLVNGEKHFCIENIFYLTFRLLIFYIENYYYYFLFGLVQLIFWATKVPAWRATRDFEIVSCLWFQFVPASEGQMPTRERWVWLRATFPLLLRVLKQVSGSKFMHASDRNLSLDVIGFCDVANRGLFQTAFLGQPLGETTISRRIYSAMVLINGLAHGLSKSILKTPHGQINNINKTLIFTTGGLLN